MLKHSVSIVPSYEEYFGLVDNDLTDADFEVEEEDEKKKQLLILALSILEEFYFNVKYYSAYEILTDDFEEKINELNTNLKDSLLYLFMRYMSEVQTDYDMEYNIPPNIVDSEINIENVVSSSVDRITDTLYSDLKDKATFYSDLALTTGVFSLHSNFRRAIKNLVNVVKWDTHHIQRLVERSYLSFVYGQEALATWKVTGVNTCNWCYELAGMGAMPLSWFPVDHINGGCWLEIENPTEYSDEYKEIQGWL